MIPLVCKELKDLYNKFEARNNCLKDLSLRQLIYVIIQIYDNINNPLNSHYNDSIDSKVEYIRRSLFNNLNRANIFKSKD